MSVQAQDQQHKGEGVESRSRLTFFDRLVSASKDWNAAQGVPVFFYCFIVRGSVRPSKFPFTADGYRDVFDDYAGMRCTEDELDDVCS
jgi:hypothetical protein